MKLTEISRGHLRVEDGDKSITLYGEAYLRGYGSRDFVLYENSIHTWDTPNGQDVVNGIEKAKLIHFLLEEFSRRQMALEIE